MVLDLGSRGNLKPLFEERLHTTVSAHLLDTDVAEQVDHVVVKGEN